MQMKLAYKLFAAFFLILAIVCGAMLLSRHIFSANFRDYMYQVELENLQRLVPLLQSAYRARGGWQEVAADPQRWLSRMHFAPDRSAAPPPPPPSDGAVAHSPPGARGPHPPPDMPAPYGPAAPTAPHARPPAEGPLADHRTCC